MEIIKKGDGNNLTVEIQGRLDTVTAPELEVAFAESLESIENLVLDFTNLEYISSAGLRVLLSTQKIMSKQGNMTLKNVNDEVMDVLEITGFSSFLTIEW